MTAVISCNPDWVINKANKRAITMIERKKAEYYGAAIDYLKLVHNAYKTKNQLLLWDQYLNTIKTAHKAKRKFMELCNSAF